MDWLRLYVEILDDPKIAKMSDKTYRIFTYLMLIARERDENGVINLSTKDISWRLRISENPIKKAIQELIELEILSHDNGRLQFINWTKRQYKSDNVTERVKRHREKKETFQETLPETLENRTDTEQIQNRTEQSKKEKNTPAKVKYLDSVFLTDIEYKKLQEAIGQKNLDVGIEKLDYSITVKGGKYRDHYKTILNWSKRGYLNDDGQGSNRGQQQATGKAQSDSAEYPVDGTY